jgi:HEAT repeat protein
MNLQQPKFPRFTHPLIQLVALCWLLLVGVGALAEDALSEQDQLAVAALEGLMAAPPERALPLLQRVLSSQRSEVVKRRALFVLGQIDTEQAQQVLLDFARNADGVLQREAIRSIGIGGRADALGALQSIFDSGDAQVRETVLQAWMIADQKELIYAVAAGAGSEAEQAVQLLGAMGASAELRRLSADGKGSASLIQAYAISDDLDALLQIVNGSGEESLRVEAVRAIGIVGGSAANEALQRIYRESASVAIREAALQGMLIADDEQGLLSLYRASNDPAEKRKLLRTLTIMGGDAALDAIDAALEGRLP